MDPNSQRQLLQTISNYFAILLRRFPEYSNWLWEQHQLHRRFSLTELHGDVLKCCEACSSIRELSLSLRKFKQKHFLRIAARDLFEIDNFNETVAQVSDLAIAILQALIRILWNHPKWWLNPESCTAWNDLSRHASFTVIGLGKLGGLELNFVSDIDLLFLYEVKPELNETRRKELSGLAQTLFPKLCTTLTRLMEDSVDGDRVFKVDLRLRPDGKDGELISPISYAVHHYLVEGQSWERLVLLKARSVAGDLSLGNQFIKEIRPFVYRRFLDFQALDEIRAMRDRIAAETRPLSPGPGFDVKFGKGGIREIEFIVQAFQLIYGGRNPELREPNTIRCIQKLRDTAGLLKPDVSSRLIDAYVFLRRAEHWIQLLENHQTQRIPTALPAIEKVAMAVMRTSASVSEFLESLRAHTEFVHDRFMELFSTKASDSYDESEIEKTRKTKCLSRRRDKDFITKALQNAVVHLKEKEEKATAVTRCESFIDAVVRRPGLVSFFEHEPSVLNLCLKSIAASELVSNILIHNPAISEGLTDAMQSNWTDRATNLLQGVESFEEKLHWLRRIKNERFIAIAIHDMMKDPAGQVVESYLNELADFFVVQTYSLICEKLNVNEREFPLCVGAMGRYGSGEMDYSSDLDLVFIYEPASDDRTGIIPEQVVRFVQRFVRLLSLPLGEGSGYQVDMRLRPSGNFGPLIVTKQGWEEYYEAQADIWEVASLLKFRPVCGDPSLMEWALQKVHHVCFRDRDPQKIWNRLCELKRRVETERVREDTKKMGLDIKLGAGGLMDLDMWCQGTAITRFNDIFPKEEIEKRSATPCSIRKLLKPVIALWNVPAYEARTIIEGFEIFRCLLRRACLGGIKIDRFRPQDLERLRNFSLLTSKHLKNGELEWNDLIYFTTRIGNWWQKVCSEKRSVF